MNPLLRCKRRACGVGLRSQSGQALIYGLFVLVSGLAGMYFLFNAGQLVREKTQLTTTADAVAYSAGVLHARALNYSAYNNRALMANEVLMAQLVSIASWARFASAKAQNVAMVHPECASMDPSALAAAALLRYSPDYTPGCVAVATYGSALSANLRATIEGLGEGVAQAIEVQKATIIAAQWQLHASGAFPGMRDRMLQQVADANYTDNGKVQVQPGKSAGLPDDWSGFVRRFAGDEREPLKGAVVVAATQENGSGGRLSWVGERSWTSSAVFTPFWQCILRGRTNEVRRRGGTALVGFDEWVAADTESWWSVRPRSFGRCSYRESGPTGYGLQAANSSDQGDSGQDPSGAMRNNPGAGSLARSEAGKPFSYSGIPEYFDLALPGDTPVLRHGVRLVRVKSQLRTTDGETGQIQAAPDNRLAGYDSALADDRMASVAVSEVYFERPIAHTDNRYGLPLRRPREVGSLFNPYWQVRLASPGGPLLQAQQRQQGAALPLN